MIEIKLPERPLEDHEKAFLYALVAISTCEHGDNQHWMSLTMREAKKTADELFAAKTK